VSHEEAYRVPQVRVGLIARLILSVGTVMAAEGSDTGCRLAEARIPFVENRGQTDSRVAFSTRTLFGTAFVTREGRLVYSLAPGESGHEPPRHAVRPDPGHVGIPELPVRRQIEGCLTRRPA